MTLDLMMRPITAGAGLMYVKAGEFFHVIEDKLQILFVDDDPILREFAIVHLTTEQALLQTAEDGLDAVEKIRACQPDLILLDLEMPNMDGFQFPEHLREAGTLMQQPIIVATGREDVLAIDRAYQAGATSFVVKPLNWRQLSYQIRYVYRTFRNERELRAERDRAQAQARRAERQLHEFANRTHRFLGAALDGRPDLLPSAARFAEDLAAGLDAVQADPSAPGASAA